MPTLLSINNYYYRRAGAETVYFDHNELLGDVGWDIVPFCMHHPKNVPSPWSRFFVDEIEFGSEYSFREKVQRVPKIIYSWEARHKLDALINEVKPDVCHAHNIYHHISPSILSLLKAKGVPTLLTLHDLKIACPAYKMLTHDGICERCKGGHLFEVVRNRCIKNSLALSTITYAEAVIHGWLRSYSDNVDRFVVPSRFYLDKFVEWGWSRDKFVHIPNFVNTESLKPEFSAGSGFVYFGRLAPEKGLRTLIKAAALAKVKVLLAGTGPEEADLRALASECAADVEFCGFRSGDDLFDLVRASRAMVLPSEWYENAPVSLMEAYALGKPVIGANIGGIPELITEEQTGQTFTSGDEQSLCNALRRFTELPDTRVEEMGRAGRRLMEDQFSPSAYRERILDVYGQLGAGTV